MHFKQADMAKKLQQCILENLASTWESESRMDIFEMKRVLKWWVMNNNNNYKHNNYI